MQQLINWNDVSTKILGSLALAAIAGIYHLWDRVRDVEAALQREITLRKEHTEDAHQVSQTLNHLTLLTAKIATLLETALTRVTMIEKKVFDM
jgi:hypothetical protein